MSSIIWRNELPSLIHRNEVHIWKADLSQWQPSAVEILSAEEKHRGEKFVRLEHQRRFMLARSFLRQILARYLGLKPAQICFRENKNGKIYLEDYSQLQFNLSHSQGLALYAVNMENDIGVDLEWVNPNLTVQPLLERFFSAAERQSVLDLPSSQQLFAFYQLWTRKEASLKALGIGLSGLTSPNLQLPQAINLELESNFAAALSRTGQDVQKSKILYFS